MNETFAKIKDFVSKHPYGIAAGIIIIGILFILFSRGSTTTTTAADGNDSVATADADAAATQAATQLAAEQLQAQTQQAATAAQVSDTTTAANAQTSIAQIQANQSVDNTNLAAQVAALTASLNATTSQDQIAAQAGVDNTQANDAVQEAQINATALEQVAEAPYDVELAEIESSQLNTNELTTIAQGINNSLNLAATAAGQPTPYANFVSVNGVYPGTTATGNNNSLTSTSTS